MTNSEQSTFQVDDAEVGTRLDALLRLRHPHLSRRLMTLLFEQRQVLIDDLPAAKGIHVRKGQRVSFKLPPEDRAHPNAELPLVVVLERDDLVVVDKPAGEACVPLSGDERGCTANALIARYPEMRDVGYGPREPGLLHRLDNDTSGLLLAARNASTFTLMREALVSGALAKEYLAIAPTPAHASGVVDTPLGPSGSHNAKVEVMANGRPVSPTHYDVLQSAGPLSLLRVRVSRAYRHQIRVHLASIGCPLVGDVLYGGADTLPRHALHAHRLTYESQASSQGFDLTSDLPRDMRDLL